MTNTREPRFSRSFLVLAGSLCVGIALASALWLLFAPRPKEIPDAFAQKMGYKNADDFNHFTAIEKEFLDPLKITDQFAKDAKTIFSGTNSHHKSELAITLGVLWNQPDEQRKALALIEPLTHDSDPNSRAAAALCLRKYNIPEARTMLHSLSGDAYPGIRNLVKEAENPKRR